LRDSLQAAIVLFEYPLGAVAGANQRPRDNLQKALFQPDFAESPELFGRHEPVYRQMVDRRAKVLAEGDDIDAD